MSKIIWLIGQPGHGKTVLAEKLVSIIETKDKVFHIDGDDLRNITTNKDYSKNGREQNIRNAQIISKFLNNKGYYVVVSLVTPYLELREEFKKNSNVFEIYVHTKEVRGREEYHVVDFEPPLSNYLSIDTTNISVENCIEEIKEYVGLV